MADPIEAQALALLERGKKVQADLDQAERHLSDLQRHLDELLDELEALHLHTFEAARET